MTFGEALQQARKHRGYTRAQLARGVHVHSATVARWETSEYHPGVRKIMEIVKVLNIVLACSPHGWNWIRRDHDEA